jgi:hypothetical protein
VQVGLRKGDQGGNPITARSRAGRHRKIWCPRNSVCWRRT